MPRLHDVGLIILSLMTVEWKFIYICKYLEREEKRRCYLSPTIVKICRFAFRFTDGERCMKRNMYLACVGAHACSVVIVVVVFTPRSSFPPLFSPECRDLHFRSMESGFRETLRNLRFNCAVPCLYKIGKIFALSKIT